MPTNINFNKVLGTNKGCNIALASNPITPLLLDTYPNAAVAYSLRKLRNAYSGSAIRVRRSVDNTEQDIAFVGNDLDTQTMLDFVGYNLLTFSEDLSSTVWLKVNLNTTGTPSYINVETAPDGTLTGDKIIESTANSTHYTNRQTISLTISNNYNISVYLKQAERNTVQIRSSISGSSQTCDLDLTNGSISNNGFVNTPVVTAEANGWYRFSVTITSGTSSPISPLLVFLSNGTSLSYAGDNISGVYIWGAQLSQTSTLKPYQKTVATAGGAGFVTTWYDQSINNNHAEQPTLLGSQAQIVSNGNLILDADTGKITSNWTADRYNLTSGISANTQYFSISMFRRSSTATDQLVHLGNTSANNPCPLWWAGSGASFSVRSYMSTLLSYENVSTIDRCIMTSLRNSANLKVAFRNGVQLTNTATQTPQIGTLNTFGQLSTVYTSGQYQEYIYWDSEQSANRVAIETNINNYWNAY